MFWDKAYTPSPNFEALLEKEDLKVEDLLDDEDILQECKAQKRNLVQYLTRPDIIKRLIELVTTEPSEHLPIAERFKYANMACEVLTFGLPSLDEKLVRVPEIFQTLYSFLEQEPPLNPLLSSFFSKTFSMLISKKPEQDWFLYQTMCLQVLEFIKNRGNFLDLIFKHFATPVIMDLLLQIIKEVQGEQLRKDFYEWLKEQQLIERLINMLGQPEESEKHDNIAEFLTELIKNGRSTRQREDNNDSFEPAFVGSDLLLQVIEEEKTLSLLLDVILSNGEDVKESCIVAGINIVLTLVDESIVDEPASDKALQIMIDKEKENHKKIVSTVIRVVAPRLKEFHKLLLNPPKKTGIVTSVTQKSPPFGHTRLQICRLFTVLLKTGDKDVAKEICETELFDTLLCLFKQYDWNNFLHSEVENCIQYVFATFDQNDNDNGFNLNPSALQKHVIVNCKIVSKLIDFWMYNKDVQSSLKGRRLGYMGHLIQIFKHITTCISNSNQIGALILSNLNEDEKTNWELITDQENGELKYELDLQNKFLANCNANDSSDFGVSIPKELQNDNFFNQDMINEIVTFGESVVAALSDIGSFQSLVPFNGVASNVDRNFKVWERSLYNDTQPLNINVSPWVADPFTNDTNSIENHNEDKSKGWENFENNFADFDAHFNSFCSNLDYNGANKENENSVLNENEQEGSNNAEALNTFKNNNDFENNDFNDRNNTNDDFEINFKNTKNFDMKFENEDKNNDNSSDNNYNEEENLNGEKLNSKSVENKGDLEESETTKEKQDILEDKEEKECQNENNLNDMKEDSYQNFDNEEINEANLVDQNGKEEIIDASNGPLENSINLENDSEIILKEDKSCKLICKDNNEKENVVNKLSCL